MRIRGVPKRRQNQIDVPNHQPLSAVPQRDTRQLQIYDSELTIHHEFHTCIDFV